MQLFLLFPLLLASNVNKMVAFYESLKHASLEMSKKPLPAEEVHSIENVAQNESASLEPLRQDVFEKITELPSSPETMSHQADKSVSFEKPVFVAHRKEPLIIDKEILSVSAKDQESIATDVAKVHESADFEEESLEWLDAYCRAFENGELQEFMDRNEDGHVKEALLFFFMRGSEDDLPLMKKKLEKEKKETSVLDVLQGTKVVFFEYNHPDKDIQEFYESFLISEISNRLIDDLKSAKSFAEFQKCAFEMNRNANNFKLFMDSLSLSEYMQWIHGKIAITEAALFFNLISVEKAVLLVGTSEDDGPYLDLARIAINTLGDALIYAHNDISEVLQFEAFRNIPILSELLKKEGSYVEHTYHYMVLLFAELFKKTPDEFKKERFRNICCIHLSALLSNQEDKVKALKGRQLLFESVPTGESAVFYAQVTTPIKGHAMLVKVEPKIKDIERVYDIRIFNTGNGSNIFHLAESGYEEGHEQRRAIYVDFKDVTLKGLKDSDWFTVYTSEIEIDSIIEKLYKSTGVEPDKTPIPSDLYQRVQLSGTCVSSVMFAYLRTQ